MRLGTPWDPPGRAGGVCRPGSLGRPSQTADSATRPRIRWMKMDGKWMVQDLVLGFSYGFWNFWL